MPTRLFFHHCRLAFPDFIAPGALLAEAGAITRIWIEETPVAPKNARALDCQGMILAPGLVDIHNHGGLSHDFVGANAAGMTIPRRQFIATTVAGLASAGLASRRFPESRFGGCQWVTGLTCSEV